MFQFNQKSILKIFVLLSSFSVILGHFLAPLSKPLAEGQTITISGKFDEKLESSFNLQVGDCNDLGSTCDVNFHLVPRFEMKSGVRDYYQGGAWKAAETYGGFPFKPDTYYKIKIIIHQNSFEININGKYYETFKNVLPLDRVNHIIIQNPKELKYVIINDKSGYFEYLENIL